MEKQMAMVKMVMPMQIKMLEEVPVVMEKEPMKLNRKRIRTCLLRKANKMEENRWSHSSRRVLLCSSRWSLVIRKTWPPWLSWHQVRTQFSKTSKITWMTYSRGKATSSNNLSKQSGPVFSSIWSHTTPGNTKEESKGCIPTSANLATWDQTKYHQTITLTTKTVLNYCSISAKSWLKCE